MCRWKIVVFNSITRKILKANHPALYWYTPKNSVDAIFAATEASLSDSLTELAFRNKISWAVNKIHCGHTVARPSKNYFKYYSKQKRSPQFPLVLKVWKDSAVVVNNLLKKDSPLSRGTIITSVNNTPINNILDSLCQLVGTDGYSNNFKYQVISFNFPGYYKNAFGLDSQYAIRYVDTLGQRKEIVIKNFYPTKDSLTEKIKPFAKLSKKELRQLSLTSKRNFKIDTALNTAFISVNTFSEGKLLRFFRRSFKEIEEKKIENVVLDFRLNSGGSVLACARLSQYLVDKPFLIADTVAAFNRTFPYKRYIRPWFVYWISMRFSGKRMDDDRIHFRYFEKHYFKQKKKYHFDGNIYVLTGGYTFSAATLATQYLKGQKNVTVVGEETGGGAYGNSAMHLTNIVLPNTKVRVVLPLYRMVLNARHAKDGRGVLPDVEVGPSSEFIRAGVDAKVEKVKELIRRRKVAKDYVNYNK